MSEITIWYFMLFASVLVIARLVLTSGRGKDGPQ